MSILALKVEHIVFIVFGLVFIFFVGCACYHKNKNKYNVRT